MLLGFLHCVRSVCIYLSHSLTHTPCTCSWHSSSVYTSFRSSLSLCLSLTHLTYAPMGWLRLVGSIKLQVSFAEYSLFYRALLQKRRIMLSILLSEATPYLRLSCHRNNRQDKTNAVTETDIDTHTWSRHVHLQRQRQRQRQRQTQTHTDMKTHTCDCLATETIDAIWTNAVEEIET